MAQRNKFASGTLSVSCFRENFNISYGYTTGCYHKIEGLHSNVVLKNWKQDETFIRLIQFKILFLLETTHLPKHLMQTFHFINVVFLEDKKEFRG